MASTNDAVQVKASADAVMVDVNSESRAIQGESEKVNLIMALLKSLKGQPAPDLTEAIAALQGVKANLDTSTQALAKCKRAVWGA